MKKNAAQHKNITKENQRNQLNSFSLLRLCFFLFLSLVLFFFFDPFVIMFGWFLINQIILPLYIGKTFGMYCSKLCFYKMREENPIPRKYWGRALILPFSFLVYVIAP